MVTTGYGEVKPTQITSTGWRLRKRKLPHPETKKPHAIAWGFFIVEYFTSYNTLAPLRHWP
jgi:hypothetical protein